MESVDYVLLGPCLLDVIIRLDSIPNNGIVVGDVFGYMCSH